MLMTVVVGILLTIFVFYPGFMSPDSIGQLHQARAGLFSDWHPPIMSWLWGLFDRLTPGPIGMLLFHSLMFWSGLALWMMLIAPKWPTIGKCLAVLAVGLFPPVFALIGTVWKDVGMTAACLLGSALLLLAERKRSLIALAFGLIAIWYAVAIRHNAVVAVFPLAVYAGKILYEQRFLPSTPWRRRDLVTVGLIGLGLLVLLLVTSSAAKLQLTKGRTSYPVQQILIHDLTAISIDTGDLLVPAYLFKSKPLTVSDLSQIYTPAGVVPLFCCDDSVARLQLTEDPELISELQNLWIRAVLSSPTAYLRHRSQVLGKMLGITEEEVCYPYHVGIVENGLGIAYEETVLQQVMWGMLGRLGNGFFRAWIYMAVMATTVVFMIWKRAEVLRASPLLLAVGVSGLLYGSAYLLVSPDCSFRMHYWPAVSAVLLVVSLLLIFTESRLADLLSRRSSG
jgi:hypothetical protein